MAPDTVSLRYFLVLAQELNFTRAAARMIVPRGVV